MDEREQRVAQLFRAAIREDPSSLGSFLERECAGDGTIRGRVERLLAADAAASSFLALSGAIATPRSLDDEVDPECLPGRIGAYTPVRLIGAGGMGLVFEAIQDRPRRTVALKVLRRGLMSREALRRFEFESQILARLRHPGIAQIYEAGTSLEGGESVPYFALEFISGAQRLTDYVGSMNLSVRQRLELFTRVCEAVQHGHQKGVVHRDLKPANILVDAAGQPKVIDFGVARTLDTDAQSSGLHTSPGALVGTLPYMSPEQLAGDPGEVDTRSDVYALGVVLYELLSGRLPYDLASKSLPEAARIVRDTEPSRLGSTSPRFRGDLETIVAKALEKDKSRRYATVNALAADLRRFLSHEPIAARRTGMAGRALRWVRRHRAVSAVGAMAVVLVATLNVFYLWRLAAAVLVAQHQEREARRQADTAEKVSAFLKNTLSAITPYWDTAHDVPVREVLDDAAQRLEAELRDQPEVQAELHLTIGSGYVALGLIDHAEPHLREALQLREELFGESHPTVAEALIELSRALTPKRRVQEAETALRRALSIAEQTVGEEHVTTVRALYHLGAVSQESSHNESEARFQRALAAAPKACGDPSPELAAVLLHVGRLLHGKGYLRDSEETLRRALDMYTSHFGAESRWVASSRWHLGITLHARGEYAAARQQYAQAIDILRNRLGEDHPSVEACRFELARLQVELDELDAAAEYFRGVIARHAEATGKPDPSPTAKHELAGILIERGEFTEAEPLCLEALEFSRRTYGDAYGGVAFGLWNLGACRMGQGDYTAAERAYTEALEMWRARFGDDHPAVATSLHNLARLAQARGDLDTARQLYEQALPMRGKWLGERHPRTALIQRDLGALYLECGEAARAEPLLCEALDIMHAAWGDRHRETLTAQYHWGRCLALLGRFEEARAELTTAADALAHGCGHE